MRRTQTLFMLACIFGAGVMLLAGPPRTATAQTAATAEVHSMAPQFSLIWERVARTSGRSTFDPPLSGPGPIIDPQDHSSSYVAWIGDASNPILKPHARAAVEARNEFIRAGRGAGLPAYSLCWPSGVPLILNVAEPLQILQTRGEVTILYRRDSQVRHVYMDRKHPDNLNPSWYGHSVGHYEGSDTLVIDTIAMDPRAAVDRFGTPRSEKMRIVERYTLAPDRGTMTVALSIEDPETFTTNWSARVTYRQSDRPMVETICAENNKDAATGEDYPIPVATKFDF